MTIEKGVSLAGAKCSGGGLALFAFFQPGVSGTASDAGK
ncbi:hypothetical protein J2S89_002834 [Arthrobacter bambusae]|nr:hypothetical protein [Arthrobacter bambusae]MDQ0098877.1 hypothetical protein [Arthrobacter bambusae]